MKNKKVAVLYGGLSAEREVSLRSGAAAAKALQEAGFTDVTLIDAGHDLPARLLELKPDVCFNSLHGTFGEDGRIQGMLELMGIPCTGSDSQSSTIAFDKLLSKVIFALNNVPTPEYVQLTRETGAPFLPCVIKPCRQGSTIGITVAKTEEEFEKGKKEAFEYDERVIAERFINGKELTIGILSSKVLPIIWIRPKSGFYDYQSKYTKGATEYVFETEMTEDEDRLIKSTALQAFESLGCASYGRVDIMYDGKTPWVLEINTLPGLTETSLLPQAAAKTGISFPELVTAMIGDALR
ncbi:D-alanine--D-alanine ligase [Geovibrio ferrireducens]|uniref:D-alanine--D-alanine ligase n=1 Tax=Geovibrio ferrireducens TaxID=46201 RepID=UPI00224568C8|nr:D-alanine--D-alanine ligase [Geovibrio ferrireducens]